MYAGPKSTLPHLFGYDVENRVVFPTEPFTQADQPPIPGASFAITFVTRSNTSKLLEHPESIMYQTIGESLWRRGGDPRYGENHNDWAISSQASKSVMQGYEEGSETKWRWAKIPG